MKRLVAAIAVSVNLFSLNALDLFDQYRSIGLEVFSDENTGLTVFPTLLVPLGGKYEGMGTAYTAVASDSGYLEANPSASAVLDNTALSLSHNNWIFDSSIEGVVFTMRVNDLGFGLGGKFLHVPFTEYAAADWGSRTSTGYYSESVATLNVSYNFLSSYRFYGFAVGANLKAAYRSVPPGIFPNQSVLTGLIDFGVLTRFNLLKFYASRSRNFSLGAVVKNLGPSVMSEPLPSVVTAGMAYSPIRPVTIAYDLSLPFGNGQHTESLSMAGGVNVTFTDFFSIQGGFNHRGANPRVSLGAALDIADVSITVNYTLDMTTQAVPLDRFSLQATLNLGDRGRGDLRDRVDELYLEGLAAYAEGELERALALFTDCLVLDPQFTPAQAFRAQTERELANRRKLRDLQS